ncbi:hypothetical protein HII31_06583 [Pseudocercospora fuligena]|uniref:RNA ligase domain-containing protein n=1 Tax=Pseudocercospora fuligena TaxID=685502 RepID=A0A8H6RJV1_9PEZI|nr:hypothetical protein HII31_06583 [Pseudocercospora fuligena]
MEIIPPIVHYPSTGKHVKHLGHEVGNYARQLQRDFPDIAIPKAFPFIGTVKLHGTHADVLQDENGRILCQSRNRLITPENDNCGFAKFVARNVDTITELFSRVSDRFTEMNLREGSLPTTKMIMLSGEWIGQGIQKGVAISQLKPAFVIFGIKSFDDRWEKIQHYANIECPGSRIYNICRGGIWHANVSTEDNGAEFETLAMRYTDQIAAACPFGKLFGVTGEGEGLVWTPSVTSTIPNKEEFWVKTKGEKFRGAPPIEKQIENFARMEMRQKIEVFAERHCHEQRLNQGLEYLAEMAVDGRRAIGTFIAWMQKDIEKEESAEIQELALSAGWRKEVARRARVWYEQR